MLYRLREDTREVIVVRIEHRRDAYRPRSIRRLLYPLGTLAPPRTPCKSHKPSTCRDFARVSDGTRTPDCLDPNSRVTSMLGHLVADDGLGAKRLGYERGVVVARRVVQVLHRGLHVGVAHPLLHAADVGLGDHPRAKRMA